MKELSRWTPTLKPVIFHGDKAAREDMANNVLSPGQRDEDRSWHVCVTTYEVCNIEKNVLNKFAWSYLIIDEAHRLKNEASTFSKTVRAFETRYRILLTGYVIGIVHTFLLLFIRLMARLTRWGPCWERIGLT
jgi:SWI/SNF-related matrix-associated actin-dependent regulator of chromatin subfamily A member 5